MRKSFSIWSAYDVELSPEDAVLAIERRGMTECELSDEHGKMLLDRGDPENTGKAFRAFAASHGVSFPQGHLFLRVALCAEDAIDVLTEWIRLFSAIGIRNAVLHADWQSFPSETPDEPVIAASVERLKLLAPVAEKYGVRICLENLRRRFDSAEKLVGMIEAVGSDALGICLDTGHLNIAGEKDQANFIRKAGKYLHALHIADNEGTTDQHMMPFGRGNVKILNVMKALDEIDYDGLFNYEIPGERMCPIEVRDMKAAYLKNVTDYLFDTLKK